MASVTFPSFGKILFPTLLPLASEQFSRDQTASIIEHKGNMSSAIVPIERIMPG
jgi:hypothetical protein